MRLLAATLFAQRPYWGLAQGQGGIARRTLAYDDDNTGKPRRAGRLFERMGASSAALKKSCPGGESDAVCSLVQ